MFAYNYLMESDQETLRLKLKTDRATLEKQAKWAGIKPGMRVADIGCGAGKTTFYLKKLIEPGGEIVGIDNSKIRIKDANHNFKSDSIHFLCKNACNSLDDIGEFDFIWVRFLLEYHRLTSFEIVRNLTKILKPGGIICLIDLDHNCLNHFEAPEALIRSLAGLMNELETNKNFDPYAGRKLYSYLYDLNFENIDVDLYAHHLFYGELNQSNIFNWITKAEVAAKQSGYDFNEFKGGFNEFYEVFKEFFLNPRRFTYTPVITCRGRKSLNGSPG
ncbi:MAG: methyltransferase domain-containing protein [Desulfobacteraceae bacterium]|nr:methyltransferase domain-containing protein [Desulfobacteraceae bacterium]MBC2756518.1 methyltransferase domain-containing protein [Desulfobacteraceae bacterium]